MLSILQRWAHGDPCATCVRRECEKDVVWFGNVAHRLSNQMLSVSVVRFRIFLSCFFLIFFFCRFCVFRGRALGRTRASGKLCLQAPTSNLEYSDFSFLFSVLSSIVSSRACLKMLNM